MLSQPLDVNTLKDGWDYANIFATSISGLIAMGALILSAIVFKRQQDDSRQAQAREVAAGHGQIEPTSDEKWAIGVEYANYSKLPIYEVRCRMWNLGRRRTQFGWMTHSGQSISDGLRPGDSRVDTIDTVLAADEWKSAVMFTDSSGRQWARFTDGALVGGVGDFIKLVVSCEDYVDGWRKNEERPIKLEDELDSKPLWLISWRYRIKELLSRVMRRSFPDDPPF